ncbi:MAG: hypothetical protein H0X29_04450 [Parachlamydiaceae bacterium]|nr:hypothetical protein [Parachlamydiaceae bacterium]
MVTNIILCFSLFFIVIFQIGYTDNQKVYFEYEIPCALELRGCLNKIRQLPEARNLIATIQREGAIQITINNDSNLTKKFGAFWDPNNRIITVNYFRGISEGSLIGSIIFEMHNALVNSKMIDLDNLAVAGKIDRDTYVEKFERLEYINSKDASRLVQQGIQADVFPRDAYLHTYMNFDEHFYVQKEAGHSEFIARNFDQLAPRKSRKYRSFAQPKALSTSSSANKAW